jgi:hypothetical protein
MTKKARLRDLFGNAKSCFCALIFRGIFMKFEMFSHPKDRMAIIPSDDVLLMLPDVFGVFDGATDPRGGNGTTGKSSGLFAAEIAARYCGRTFSDLDRFSMTTQDLMLALTAELAIASSGERYQSRPTTTMAIALIGPGTVRIIVSGDSGVRVNGATIYRHEKCIDDVSAAARIAVFNLLLDKGGNPDGIEISARRAIFQGLDTCVNDGVLNQAETDELIASVAKSLSEIANAEIIESFLRNGIKSQSEFGNDDDHPLGFSVLNGSSPSMKDVIDVSLDIKNVKSIELFSDGYFAVPTNVTIEAWEQMFAEIEKIDPHKLHKYPNVKGSTTTDFSDDRSVIILTNI